MSICAHCWLWILIPWTIVPIRTDVGWLRILISRTIMPIRADCRLWGLVSWTIVSVCTRLRHCWGCRSSGLCLHRGCLCCRWRNGYLYWFATSSGLDGGGRHGLCGQSDRVLRDGGLRDEGYCGCGLCRGRSSCGVDEKRCGGSCHCCGSGLNCFYNCPSSS